MADELIDGYLEYLRTCRRSPRTITKRGTFLNRIDAQLPCGLPAASAEELTAWLYRDEFSDWTLATYYFHMAGFFAWAADPRIGHLDFNPVLLLPKPSPGECLPRPVTDAQHGIIMNNLHGPLLLAAHLAAYAGLRCIEICRADREHITRENVTIPQGKGNRPGIVPTHPLIWASVQDMPLGPLLRTDAGRRWNEHQLSQAGSRTMSKLIGEVCGYHRLRHWFGTTVYRRTRDLRRTQEALRHRSPNSTMIYTLIADEERREAIEALPAPVGQ